jgi:hypothetical protein
METQQQKPVVEQAEPNGSRPWKRDADEPDEKRPAPWNAPSDESHSLEEPGYGHGV